MNIHLHKVVYINVIATNITTFHKMQAYADILNRVRDGQHTEEDVETLNTRLISIMGLSEMDPVMRVTLHIFPTHKACAYNETHLLSLPQDSPIYRVPAQHALLEKHHQQPGVPSA